MLTVSVELFVGHSPQNLPTESFFAFSTSAIVVPSYFGMVTA